MPRPGARLTRLEHLLGIDRDQTTLAAYPLPRPHNRWDAIQQGERVAAEERRRLELGLAPLPDVSELLEVQGVRTARIDLPEDVSGLTLMAPDLGFFVVANRAHPTLRRRFSYAHEYGHVLLDREARSLVSLGRDRDQLVEVRANAFAAAFLMPEAAVRHLVRTLGKGHPSRAEAEVFDEQAPVKARARTAPGSQAIQLYDVVHVAHHFGVSRPAALYRLKSLKLVTEPELQALRDQDGAGQGRALARVLGLPEPDHAGLRDEFRHRFLGLALEAYRREVISRAKLVEVAALVNVGAEKVAQALDLAGLEDDGADVVLPRG